ncbi:MAG: tetratricopeptide repeat protein [Verrucomicrobiota bacterium]
MRAAFLAAVLFAAGCQPHGPEALSRGDELLRAGKATEAVPMLERAATELSEDPRAWNFLGLAYHAAGRPAEAQKAYLRALRANRDFFDAHYNLGALYVEQGEWAEAERSLRTFLAPDANHGHPVAYHLLGQAQLQLRKHDDAERSLAFAVKLAPKDADVWNDLGLVQSGKRRFANARQYFAWAVKLDPRHAASRLNLAVTAQQLGDKRGALQTYREYLALAPAAPDAVGIRAVIRQLEAQTGGAPLPPVLTNAPGAVKVVTNLAPRPADITTNSVPKTALPAAQPVPANPVVEPRSAPVKTIERAAANPVNAPPAASAKTSVAAPVPEVVRVEDAPALRPARDEIPPKKAPSVPAVAVVAAPSPAKLDPFDSTPSDIVDDLPGNDGTTGDRSEPGRRTFWKRVNPVSWGNPVKWFGSGPKPEKPVTVLRLVTHRPATASKTLPIPATAAATPIAAAVKPAAAAVSAKPVFPRYVLRAPASLPAGKRTEAERFFGTAIAAHDRHDLADALVLYQHAVELDPSYLAAHHNLALVAMEEGDVQRALLAAECAARIDPGSVPALRVFAAALQRGGFPSDAADQLDRLVGVDPSDVAAQLSLAGLKAGPLGDPGSARSHYERVLALDPRHPQAAAIRVWLSSNP